MSHKSALKFLNGKAFQVAPKLLGCVIQRHIDGKTLKARIVETEAYDQTDAASHSYKGETTRTQVMFGPAGHLYVYFTYGMHYCCNVVVGNEGEGSAVLIRAVEPLEGIDEMIKKRRGQSIKNLTNGPAKLCQALGINMTLNGHYLQDEPLVLLPGENMGDKIIQTSRIGISRAKDVPWRFYIKDNSFVSVK